MFFIPNTKVRHPFAGENRYLGVRIIQLGGRGHLKFNDGEIRGPLTDYDFMALIEKTHSGMIHDTVYEYYDNGWRYGVGTPPILSPDGQAGDVFILEWQPMVYMGKMYWKHILTGEEGHDDMYFTDPTKRCGDMPSICGVRIIGGPFPVREIYSSLCSSKPVGKTVEPFQPYFFYDGYLMASSPFTHTVDIGAHGSEGQLPRYSMTYVLECGNGHLYDRHVYHFRDGEAYRLGEPPRYYGSKTPLTVTITTDQTYVFCVKE